jgi:hypothetical protein
MKKIYLGIIVLLCILSLVSCESEQTLNLPTSITIKKDVLLDKIRGGWIGKAYGVTYGGPTEFRYMGKMIEGPIELEDDWIERILTQDDIYVNMVFLETLADSGLEAKASAFANSFAYAGFGLGHANCQARQNLLAGVPPHLSGHPYYSAHAEDIDFQIEADFIGLISPGLPQSALEICDRVGHIMNYGDGYYGGVFVAAMYAAAFLTTDINVVLDAGLSMIPEESGYAKIVRDVIKFHKMYPTDWKKTWQEIQKKYAHLDICPWGVTGAHGSLKGQFNIQASLNGAYIVLGMLYGEGDIKKSVDISTRAGQDSDCNPSNVAGIIGIMKGYENLPSYSTEPFVAYLDKNFSHTRFSVNSGSEKCLELAIENIRVNGGSVEGDEVVIAVQSFISDESVEIAFPTLTASDAFWVTDNRIRWHGSWSKPEGRRKGRPASDGFSYSEKAGDYMEVDFPGTAIYVQGHLRYNHGIIKIFIDGKSMGTNDLYHLKKWPWGSGQSSAVWITGLPDGTHTLRIEVSGEKNEESEGTRVGLGRIACYRGEIAPLPNK